MEVSKELRSVRGLQWIEQMRETSALLGAAVRIMHPSLYMSGLKAIRAIQNGQIPVDKSEGLANILQFWASPFTGLSLMNNRQTPFHRDSLGCYEWMDLLATVGPYTEGILQMPGLGLEFEYDSGTVVGVSGRAVRHGAQSNGERLCFAYYMRENVTRAHGLETDFANIVDVGRGT